MRGALIKLAVYLASGPIQKVLEGVTSGGSNLAHLSELGGNHLPHFSIKWHEWGLRRGFSILGIEFSLKIREEKKKERKKSKLRPFCNTSVTFLRSIPWMFFAVLHRSSIFNRLVFYFLALNSLYAPLGVHSCFLCFHLHSSTFGILFSSF